MKYYVIAGEASGDVHGANLVHNIKKLDPDAEIRAWGGVNLRKEGASIVKDINEMSFMGFIEVLFCLWRILKLLKYCRLDIKKFNPDIIILIDYPGFNLRIAHFAKNIGIKTAFYISPQVWAWNRSRIKQIKRYVDVMITILPFEVDFYKKYYVNAHYFGHPLTDELAKYMTHIDTFKREHIAVLPGSRKSEISRMLPVFVEVAKMFPDEKFIVASMSIHDYSYYERYIGPNPPPNISLAVDQTYDILSGAKAAIVTSGTATLETAIFKVPQVVCYKINQFSYFLARLLSQVKYISLVNLVLNRQLIVELIQRNCNKYYIANELKKILTDDNYRQVIFNGYDELCNILMKSGASHGAAQLIVSEARK